MENSHIHIDPTPILIREYMGKIGRNEFYIRVELDEVDIFWFDMPTNNETELREEVLLYFRSLNLQ